MYGSDKICFLPTTFCIYLSYLFIYHIISIYLIYLLRSVAITVLADMHYLVMLCTVGIQDFFPMLAEQCCVQYISENSAVYTISVY